MTDSNNKNFHEEDLELCMAIAHLLGWTNLILNGGAILGRPPEGSPHSRDQARVPNWANDFNDCCKLGVAMECYPSRLEVEYETRWGSESGRIITDEHAYRLAMLRLVLNELTRQKR